jgi:WD40 repeat protein
VAFSPGGKILASGSLDETVLLRDLARRQLVGDPLKAHDSVWSVAFSSDGRILASAGIDGADKEVQLWDVARRERLGQPLRWQTDGTSSATTVAFSPNGKSLASVSGDTTMLWDVNFESWISRLCAIANRNLSLSEWQRYVGPNIGYSKICPNLPPGDGVESAPVR